MSKKIQVRPSRQQSMFGVVVGCIFIGIGLFIAIPTAGLFGLLWTGMAIVVTITHAINAFGEKGMPESEIIVQDDIDTYPTTTQSIEQRLKQLEELYEKRLITTDEYEAKRKEIINAL